VVIVTGSGSGIGRVMAGRFAAEGARVGVVDWHGDRAQEASSAIPGSVPIVADVSSEEDVESMAATVRSHLGPVDVLINNAAIADGDDVLKIDAQTWDHDVRVVLRSVFLCSKAVLPSMIERRGGVIVNITSVNGMSALGNEAYSAAKAGVINLTCALARALAPRITVNSISLGFVDTELLPPPDESLKQHWLSGMPIGRFIQPAEVATFVATLVEQRSVTGEDVVIDGGWTLADS
jgi:NAD(P)-dependent dehydrogenase (short-subunit alcohol dehydrogenase family)